MNRTENDLLHFSLSNHKLNYSQAVLRRCLRMFSFVDGNLRFVTLPHCIWTTCLVLLSSNIHSNISNNFWAKIFMQVCFARKGVENMDRA